MKAVLFGKLPSHGDFLARGMASDAVDRWDVVAAEGLDAARAALGDAFEDAHGAAPPWRFVTRAGTGWSAGVLAPSMDSAGRRFVLLLAAEGLSAAEAGGLGAAVAEQLEGVLYGALGEQLTADETYARAAEAVSHAGLGAPAAALLGAAPAASVWWTLGGETHLADALAADRPTPALFTRMLTPAQPLSTPLEEAAA